MLRHKEVSAQVRALFHKTARIIQLWGMSWRLKVAKTK